MSDALSWPLIITAGGSQLSHAWYSRFLDTDSVTLCQDHVAQHFQGFTINLAQPGSSSRRIMRRTLYECITQQRLNPGQKILVIMELSFDVRKEIWIDGWHKDDDYAEGNFMQIQLSNDHDWWQGRANRVDKDHDAVLEKIGPDRKFLEGWIKSQRYFHSSESEAINLLMDLVMLTSFFREHDVGYCIFRGNPSVEHGQGLLLDTFRHEIMQDPNILDLDHFSFTGWCVEQGLQPLDYHDQPTLGHPSLEAHERFSQSILVPILEKSLIDR